MTAAIRPRTATDQREDSDWLYHLLADIRREVARRPSRQAIERMRSRLLAQIKAPTKAAA